MHLRKYSFLILIAVLAVTAVLCSGCATLRVCTKMEADSETVYRTTVGEFDYSQVDLTLTYSDGAKETVKLTEDLVPAEEKLKLFHPGEQTLKIVYGNIACRINIFVERYSMDGIELIAPEGIVYDGQPHSVQVSGDLPSGATVEYPLGNTFTSAGEYHVTAAVSCDGYDTVLLSTTLIIARADYDLSIIDFHNESVVYDGKVHALKAAALPSDVSAVYTTYADERGTVPVSEAVNVGTYYVKMAVFLRDTQNFNAPSAPLEATLTITKAKHDMSAVTMADKTVTFVGTAHTIAPKGKLPVGVSIKSTTYTPFSTDPAANAGGSSAAAVKAGKYTVAVSFAYDTVNYEPVEDVKALLTIEKAKINLTDVTLEPYFCDFDGMMHSAAIKGSLPADVVATYTYNGKTDGGAIAAGSYNVHVTFGVQRADAENFAITPSSLDSTMIIRTISYNTPFSADNISYRSGAAEGEARYRTTHVEEGIAVNVVFTSTDANGETVTVSPDALVLGERYGYTATLTFADPIWATSAIIPAMSGEMYLREQIEVESIGWNTTTFTYNGLPHAVTLDKVLPEGVITYYNNERTVAGKNEVTALVDTDHYILMDATGKSYSQFDTVLTIERATIDLSGIALHDKTVPYDGTPHNLDLEGVLPDGVTISWNKKDLVKGGSYKVTATFEYDKENYIANVKSLSAVLTVARYQLNTSGFIFPNLDVVYDGSKCKAELIIPSDIPPYFSVVYENNESTDVCDLTAKATLVFDPDSIEIISGETEFEAIFRIRPKPIDVTAFEAANGLNEGSVTKRTFSFELDGTSAKGNKPHQFIIDKSSIPADVPYTNQLEAPVYGAGLWETTVVIGGGNYEKHEYQIQLEVLVTMDALERMSTHNYFWVGNISYYDVNYYMFAIDQMYRGSGIVSVQFINVVDENGKESFTTAMPNLPYSERFLPSGNHTYTFKILVTYSNGETYTSDTQTWSTPW
ncbi:MAG: hypothetical protein MJ082_02505 [Clostridia bacterium]|nr:hypothetical protein [Clostridia bacterium]